MLSRLLDTNSTMSVNVSLVTDFLINKVSVHREITVEIRNRRMDTTRRATDRDICELANA